MGRWTKVISVYKFLPAGAGQRMASSLLLNLNPTNANKHFKAQDAKNVRSKDV